MKIFMIIIGVFLMLLGFILGVEQIGLWATVLKSSGAIILGLGFREYIKSK